MIAKFLPFTSIVIPALDKSELKGQLNHSPGFAKIAPYLPCHRDSFSAKVPGSVTGWLRQVTLTAHTRWPLAPILARSTSNLVILIALYKR